MTVDWKNRSQCHFELEGKSGNFVFIITNGYLNDVVITCDKEIKFYDEIDTNKDYYQFIGKSISFRLLTNTSKSENKAVWQAFQGFAYHVDNVSRESYLIDFKNSSNFEFSNFNMLIPLTSEIAKHCIWIFHINVMDTYLKVLRNLDMKDNSSAIACNPYIRLNQLGPYHSNATEVFKLGEAFNLSTISYSNHMRSVDYKSLRGLVSVAHIDNRLSTNCAFTNTDENTFIFSSFDLIHGYENNAHCIQKVKAESSKYHAFWFQTFHLEAAYDNVTVYNAAEFEVIKMLPGHTYVAPSYDLFFQFDSDGSITQAGFKVVIKEFDCSVQNMIVTIPCSGIKNTTYLDNFYNPHVFCVNQKITISYNIEEECANETDLIALHYTITDSILYGFVQYAEGANDGYPLLYARTVIPVNFVISLSSSFFFDILDTTDIWCLLTQYRIPTPRRIDTIILNETTTHGFYDLSKIPDNGYIEIKYEFPRNMMIDYFFATDSDYGVLDFYEGFFETYIAPIEHISAVHGSIKNWRFMPRRYTSFAYTFIYTEKQGKNSNPLMFTRVNDVEISNCLFEHDVIDARSLAEGNGKLTMVNNGTEACTVTLLNPFKEKRIYLDEFWTNSAYDPIEVHDEQELLFTFTKFDKIGEFFLKNNVYRFVLPPRTSFTVIGRESKLT